MDNTYLLLTYYLNQWHECVRVLETTDNIQYKKSFTILFFFNFFQEKAIEIDTDWWTFWHCKYSIYFFILTSNYAAWYFIFYWDSHYIISLCTHLWFLYEIADILFPSIQYYDTLLRYQLFFISISTMQHLRYLSWDLGQVPYHKQKGSMEWLPWVTSTSCLDSRLPWQRQSAFPR